MILFFRAGCRRRRVTCDVSWRFCVSSIFRYGGSQIRCTASGTRSAMDPTATRHGRAKTSTRSVPVIHCFKRLRRSAARAHACERINCLSWFAKLSWAIWNSFTVVFHSCFRIAVKEAASSCKSRLILCLAPGSVASELSTKLANLPVNILSAAFATRCSMASSGFIVETACVFASEEGNCVSFISYLYSAYAVLLLNLLEGESLALDESDQLVI